MDIDWTLVNRAKNLTEDQLKQPVLELPIIRDYRQPLLEFLRPGMKILDIGANRRSLKEFLEQQMESPVAYKSMDIDRSYEHDFYSLEEIKGQFDAIACFEVIEHLTPGRALDMFRKAHQLLSSGGRVFVSTPNVYHPCHFGQTVPTSHLFVSVTLQVGWRRQALTAFGAIGLFI